MLFVVGAGNQGRSISPGVAGTSWNYDAGIKEVLARTIQEAHDATQNRARRPSSFNPPEAMLQANQRHFSATLKNLKKADDVCRFFGCQRWPRVDLSL